MQLLWRSALWVVREAHPDPAHAGCWWVVVGRGPGRPSEGLRLWTDAAGQWWLQPGSA